DRDLRVGCTAHTHAPQVVEVSPAGVVRRPAASEVALDPSAFCFINPGSVGQPRDGDERAAYAVFDPELHHIWFYRVAYDVRRITRDNARRGIKLGSRAATSRSLMSRLFDPVPLPRFPRCSSPARASTRDSRRLGVSASPAPSWWLSGRVCTRLICSTAL